MYGTPLAAGELDTARLPASSPLHSKMSQQTIAMILRPTELEGAFRYVRTFGRHYQRVLRAIANLTASHPYMSVSQREQWSNRLKLIGVVEVR